MAVATYVAREATITRTPSGGAAAAIGVAIGMTIRVENEMIRVDGIGEGPNATDLKEDTQTITGTIRKAYVDATFWDSIVRNANGYLTPFTLAWKVKDKTGNSPYPIITITASGCKAKSWEATVPNKGEVIVEGLEFEALTIARATATEA